MVSILTTFVTDTYGCDICFFRGIDWVSVDARITVTVRNARRFVRHGVSNYQQRRPRLYINHFGHPAATLRLSTPRPRPTAPFTSAPPHVPPPTTTLFYASHTCVRRCQPRVLLTDVRIDNLCPLIMTVRSRARRYLTVRLIAISREFDGMFRVPCKPKPEDTVRVTEISISSAVHVIRPK